MTTLERDTSTYPKRNGFGERGIDSLRVGKMKNSSCISGNRYHSVFAAEKKVPPFIPSSEWD